MLIHGLGPVADLDGPRAVLITGDRIVAIDAEAEALADADAGIDSWTLEASRRSLDSSSSRSTGSGHAISPLIRQPCGTLARCSPPTA